MDVRVRKGQGPEKLEREEFGRRFRAQFDAPAFETEEGRAAVSKVEAIAWEEYCASNKAPRTRPAGDEFEDPKHELSVEWLAARQRLRDAGARFANASAPRRVLLISGASRNDKTCPGEAAKSFRLVQAAKETLESEHAFETDVLDLSLLTSEYGRTIHPCKACVSTAMPLCHWPCSCYPNHSLGQTHDWMNEIYERWTLAHGVVIVTPVYWYGPPSGLKLMIDRLVCADGGNPDPTRTKGKDPERAKKLELAGWAYPKHLAGRAFGLMVHGDVAGTEALRRSLHDWLSWMGLVSGGDKSAVDRMIGYYEPYATSHDTLDRSAWIVEEMRNVARAVAHTVNALRDGTMTVPDAGLKSPRPK